MNEELFITKACEGCSQEFKCKLKNELCDICDRRIQAAKNKSITALYPTPQDVKDYRQALRAEISMQRELKTFDKDKVCKNCGGHVAKNSVSGLCGHCFNKSGDVCHMEGCDNRLSPRNKSGYCRHCARIIYGRKKLGLDLYAPIKRRKPKTLKEYGSYK